MTIPVFRLRTKRSCRCFQLQVYPMSETIQSCHTIEECGMIQPRKAEANCFICYFFAFWPFTALIKFQKSIKQKGLLVYQRANDNNLTYTQFSKII